MNISRGGSDSVPEHHGLASGSPRCSALNQAKAFGKRRFQYFMDAIDTPNFLIDYRDGKDTPKLGFGFDVSEPTRFNYGPALADGTVRGDYSFQVSTSTNTTNWLTAETNLHWKVADALTLKAGGQ